MSETDDDTDDRSIAGTIDDLFDARAKIFKHVGYVEQWRDMPFEDSRDNYWAISGTFGGRVKFSPSREALVYWLEEHDDEYGPYGDKLYENEIYATHHDDKDGIHRGAELTMICVDTNTDGNMFFRLFRNDHEVTLPEEPEPEVETTNGTINGAINGEPRMLLGHSPTPATLLDPPSVVFVRTTTGSDETGDGTTEEMAYRSMERALKDITTRHPSESHCVIDIDGAEEVGRRFRVR